MKLPDTDTFARREERPTILVVDDAPASGRRHWSLRVPWLLLAAILLAAALSGLLLFGAR